MSWVYENIELICKIGIGIGAFVLILSIVLGSVVAAQGGAFFTGARIISIIGGLVILGLSIFGLIKSNS